MLYYSYVACCFDFFSLCLQFPSQKCFKNDKRYAFPMQFSKIVSVDEYVILLEGNTARNPEFDYDRFKLAVMNNSECKVNYIEKMICQSQLRLCISLASQNFLFSETKRRKPQRCTWEERLKNKRETSIASQS